MWIYEKKLEFPVKITQPDARLAKIMIEQYGGEMAQHLGVLTALREDLGSIPSTHTGLHH